NQSRTRQARRVSILSGPSGDASDTRLTELSDLRRHGGQCTTGFNHIHSGRARPLVPHRTDALWSSRGGVGSTFSGHLAHDRLLRSDTHLSSVVDVLRPPGSILVSPLGGNAPWSGFRGDAAQLPHRRHERLVRIFHRPISGSTLLVHPRVLD